MIRTRDFLLLLISIAFLVVIVTAETARQWFSGRDEDVPVLITPTFSDVSLADISAVATERDGVDRQGNIARLREQLATFLANPPEPEIVLVAPPDEVSSDDSDQVPSDIPTISGNVLLCSGHRSYVGAWPNQLLTIEVQEGVRVISHQDSDPNGVGGQVVAVLPIRTLANPASPSCLPTDVVAVAQSGGLIRNNEAGGYRAFPEHVLIGYTIDGFSLYGHSARETDHCGGVMVDGEYRYYLSENRETVLNCFVAPPVTLP
ncbi:MAG: hypothetical protein ACK42D_03345 [Candidatus Paceibacteria bacterium]